MKNIYEDLNLNYNSIKNVKLPDTKPDNPVVSTVYLDGKTLYVYTKDKTWEVLVADITAATEENLGGIKLLKTAGDPVEKVYFYTYGSDYIVLTELYTGTTSDNLLTFLSKPQIVNATDQSLIGVSDFFVYNTTSRVWVQNIEKYSTIIAHDTTTYTNFTSGLTLPTKDKMYLYTNSSDSTIKFYSFVKAFNIGDMGCEFPLLIESEEETTLKAEGIIDKNVNIAALGTNFTYILLYNNKLLDKLDKEITLAPAGEELPDNSYKVELTENNSAYVNLSTIHESIENIDTTLGVHKESIDKNTSDISDLATKIKNINTYSLVLTQDYATGSTVDLGSGLTYDSTSLKQVTVNGLPAVENTDYTVGSSTFTTNIDLVEGDLLTFSIIL